MVLRGLAAAFLAVSAVGQVSARRAKLTSRRAPANWERWLGDPRSLVLLVLTTVLLLGGGRKLRQAWRARTAVGRLGEGDVSPEAIAAAAEHGRAGLMELFQILGSAESTALRDAAGHALSVLWARDELIPEEEKGLVRRGYLVRWTARRRYPRGLKSAIPITVDYGVPFLRNEGAGVRPDNLEWSHRVFGARRASLEAFSPWTPGPARGEFTVIPSDFETDGPHKLILQTRVRTRRLTDFWEMELPHILFSFEFDPLLGVDALLALPDASRGEAITRALRLVGGRPKIDMDEASEAPAFLPLNDGLAVRDVPVIEVVTPLTCDLSHALEIEFEGVSGRFGAGALTLSGQGDGGPDQARSVVRFPVGPVAPLPAGAIERPGTRAMRVRLVPDPDRGWADPEVRSIWPGPIETAWLDVEIVRR